MLGLNGTATEVSGIQTFIQTIHFYSKGAVFPINLVFSQMKNQLQRLN